MESRSTFKKVYIEVTNICNLNCPFCIKTTREKSFLSVDEFKIILKKIYPYTKYIYLHVLGEPFIHPNINELIDIASKNFKVNITSNGYLLNNATTSNIRQLNISLHSFDENNGKAFDDYINDIFNYTDKNSNKVIINYRLWTNSKYFGRIIKTLEDKYNVRIDSSKKNNQLDDNVFINFEQEFIWPDKNDKFITDKGKCYAISDHIAILSDGSITACCLDANGKLSFGNIFSNDLDEIIQSDQFIKMKSELKNGIRTNPVCKKCNFCLLRKN